MKIKFIASNENPILKLFKQWKKLIHEQNEKANNFNSCIEIDMNNIKLLLEQAGFTDVMCDGSRFNGTYKNVRYLGITLSNKLLEIPVIDDISGDIIQNIHFDYSIKDKL